MGRHSKGEPPVLEFLQDDFEGVGTASVDAAGNVIVPIGLHDTAHVRVILSPDHAVIWAEELTRAATEALTIRRDREQSEQTVVDPPPVCPDGEHLPTEREDGSVACSICGAAIVPPVRVARALDQQPKWWP